MRNFISTYLSLAISANHVHTCFSFISTQSLSRSPTFSSSSEFRNINRGTQFKFHTGSEDDTAEVPTYIQSPVLQLVYHAILSHMAQYGNPNIPLGTTDGKRCKTLRRHAFENKLSAEEMDLLSSMNFRFNSLEDVYEEADFDDCLKRLVAYEKEQKNNYQIPKKYKPDSELGAWVTMIRRIGRDNIETDRRHKLDNIAFSWVSSRKCGSAFMKNYRHLKECLESYSKVDDEGIWKVVDEEGVKTVLRDETMMKWVRAQRDAAEMGNLIEARCEFLDQLLGLDWRDS